MSNKIIKFSVFTVISTMLTPILKISPILAMGTHAVLPPPVAGSAPTPPAGASPFDAPPLDEAAFKAALTTAIVVEPASERVDMKNMFKEGVILRKANVRKVKERTPPSTITLTPEAMLNDPKYDKARVLYPQLLEKVKSTPFQIDESIEGNILTQNRFLEKTRSNKLAKEEVIRNIERERDAALATVKNNFQAAKILVQNKITQFTESNPRISHITLAIEALENRKLRKGFLENELNSKNEERKKILGTVAPLQTKYNRAKTMAELYAKPGSLQDPKKVNEFVRQAEAAQKDLEEALSRSEIQTLLNQLNEQNEKYHSELAAVLLEIAKIQEDVKTFQRNNTDLIKKYNELNSELIKAEILVNETDRIGPKLETLTTNQKIREACTQLIKQNKKIEDAKAAITDFNENEQEIRRRILSFQEAKKKRDLLKSNEKLQLVSKLDGWLNTVFTSARDKEEIEALHGYLKDKITYSPEKWTAQHELDLLMAVDIVKDKLEKKLMLPSSGASAVDSGEKDIIIAELRRKLKELEEQLGIKNSTESPKSTPGTERVTTDSKAASPSSSYGESSTPGSPSSSYGESAAPSSSNTSYSKSATRSSFISTGNDTEILHVADPITKDTVYFTKESITDENGNFDINLIKEIVKSEQDDRKKLVEAALDNPLEILEKRNDIKVETVKNGYNDKSDSKIVQVFPFFSNIDDESSADATTQARIYVQKIEQMSPEEATTTLKKLSSQALEQVQPIKQATTILNNTMISNRLDTINIDLFGRGKGVSSGDDDQTLLNNIWISGLYGRSSQGSYKNNAPYNGNIGGGAVGIDFNINEDSIIGLAYSNISSKFKFKQSRTGDQINTNTHLVSLYGQQHMNDNIFVQGIFSFNTGKINTKDKRFDRTSKGEIKNTGYNLDVSILYKIKINYNLVLVPNIGISYGHYKDGAYDETGAGLYNISKEARSSSSLAATVGTKIMMLPIQISDNLEIIPAMHASLTHSLQNNSQQVKGKFKWQNSYFNNDVSIGKLPKTSYNFGISVQYRYKNIEMTTAYDCQVKTKYQSHQGTVKLKLLF